MMRGLLRKLWKRIYDDIAVYLATLGGVLGSIAWPMVLAMALRGEPPQFAAVDLVRLLGASIVALVLAVRADQQGTPEQRNAPAALRRRVNAAFARGFGWQAAVAALTAAATGAGG
jgi:hypothetical protein